MKIVQKRMIDREQDSHINPLLRGRWPCNKLWAAFWVDNDTHFRSFYGHFYCFKKTASIVRKTKDAITDG